MQVTVKQLEEELRAARTEPVEKCAACGRDLPTRCPYDSACTGGTEEAAIEEANAESAQEYAAEIAAATGWEDQK